MLTRIGRPSPALVVALLALFISIGGVAGALPGKNTVDSGDVKKNTLKGRDIKESKLGKVPRAALADTVEGACPAGTVFHEAACIETGARAALTFDAATVECLAAQRRLPTVAELQTLRLRVALSGEEWTSHEWDRDTDFRALSVRPDGTTDGNGQGATTNQFRCVATWP